MTIQDRVKRLYQRHLGPGHMVSSREDATARLLAEYETLPPSSTETPLFEPIGNGLVRLHLRPAKAQGLRPETIAGMFTHTANTFAGDRAAFRSALSALAQTDADRKWLAAYEAEGCPDVHHSEAYRTQHRPAYRVVYALYAQALPLLLRMDAMERGVIALDGPCASGKSTLADALAGAYGAGVIHMDDFFLRPEQRTPERYATPGGNFDLERFSEEVVPQLRTDGPLQYRPFDCGTLTLRPPVTVPGGAYRIVEGSYCLHPALFAQYDLRVFLQIDPQTQRQRLIARSGEALFARFENEWIPMEQRYAQAFDIPARCDIHLSLIPDEPLPI